MTIFGNLHAESLAVPTSFSDTEPRTMTAGPIGPKLQFDWLVNLLRKNLGKRLVLSAPEPGLEPGPPG